MKAEQNKTSILRVATASALLVAAAVLVAPAIHVRAQQLTPQPLSVNIQIDGFQPNSSSPFAVTGDLISQGVWQRLAGPVLGTPYSVIPSAGGFVGAQCQAEYSQDQFTSSDGSTILANGIGIRCTPNGSQAHTTLASTLSWRA